MVSTTPGSRSWRSWWASWCFSSTTAPQQFADQFSRAAGKGDRRGDGHREGHDLALSALFRNAFDRFETYITIGQCFLAGRLQPLDAELVRQAHQPPSGGQRVHEWVLQ
jgi:hypothetical protein